ncbi:acyl-CoA carboxylase epsilon subunit [Streptomyces sp. NPDC057877]|uniref:acyl-CoA carboxylase epsilon subunit n=1 Tax=Streptomyces sp. NPDC057877 TaxID=3346269 RepID=UPI0036ADBA68
MDGGHRVWRVERGQAGAEELAALAAVLLAVRARAGEPGAARPVLGWRWWARRAAYAPPGSWR